jgi:copper(I)-binding protein
MPTQARLGAIMIAAAVLAATGAAAHTASEGSLKVVHPWLAPADAGTTTTAHPTLQNTGEQPLVITGARSKAARDIRLVRDGRPVERITLDGGETLGSDAVALELRGLTVDLPAGKAVPIRLELEDQPAVTVRFAIGRDTMDPNDTVRLPGDGTE